jgi:hypothetical protein
LGRQETRAGVLASLADRAERVNQAIKPDKADLELPEVPQAAAGRRLQAAAVALAVSASAGPGSAVSAARVAQGPVALVAQGPVALAAQGPVALVAQARSGRLATRSNSPTRCASSLT